MSKEKLNRRVDRLSSFWASEEFKKLNSKKRRKLDKRLKKLVRKQKQI